jgi:hypothetical protein
MLKDGEIPKYQLQQPHPCPVMDRWKPAWLQDDHLGSRKQRHSSTHLRAFPGGVSGFSSWKIFCLHMGLQSFANKLLKSLFLISKLL